MKRRKLSESTSLDLSSFMNLMVVLIPVLLASVEFSKIATIDAKSEMDRLANGKPSSAMDSTGMLKATILTSDSTITVGYATGFRETIRFRASKNSSDNGTVVAVNATGTPIEALYETTSGDLLTDSTGTAVAAISKGIPYWKNGDLNGLSLRDTIICEKRPLRAIDQLASHLRAVRSKAVHAKDRDDVTIGSDSSVVFDLLVQCMDAAEMSGFENLAFAKIRQ